MICIFFNLSTKYISGDRNGIYLCFPSHILQIFRGLLNPYNGSGISSNITFHHLFKTVIHIFLHVNSQYMKRMCSLFKIIIDDWIICIFLALFITHSTLKGLVWKLDRIYSKKIVVLCQTVYLKLIKWIIIFPDYFKARSWVGLIDKVRERWRSTEITEKN